MGDAQDAAKKWVRKHHKQNSIKNIDCLINTMSHVASEDLKTVNPHYLGRAIDLGEHYQVCASEDIYDAKGVKLLAKGAVLAPGMQERLIRHKLHKPLETSLSVADGVTIDMVVAVARQLFDELPPLQACAGAVSARDATLEVLARIGLNNSMATGSSQPGNWSSSDPRPTRPRGIPGGDGHGCAPFRVRSGSHADHARTEW